MPVAVSSSPHSHISPPLLTLSAADTNESYRQALKAASPQVVRHDLRSLVSLSDLETVVVSSRGVKVYSPYEQPTHKGLSRAISFGGPHTNRSVLVATIQYAHNSDRGSGGSSCVGASCSSSRAKWWACAGCGTCILESCGAPRARQFGYFTTSGAKSRCGIAGHGNSQVTDPYCRDR